MLPGVMTALNNKRRLGQNHASVNSLSTKKEGENEQSTKY